MGAKMKSKSVYFNLVKDAKINPLNNNEKNDIEEIDENNKRNSIHRKKTRFQSCILKKELNRIIEEPVSFRMYKTHKKKISKNASKEYSENLKKYNEIQESNRNKSEIEEQTFDFYINDNLKNKEQNLKNNKITTTKYNFLTFIPKGLLYQFSRLSNIYFLVTAIVQSIPLISPLSSVTAIVPLIFVLGVSLIRELIEDIVRNNYDSINNNAEIIVYRNGEFITSFSKTLRSGEIIIVYDNRNIPADMIVLDSGFKNGTCYVETSSLDGEKALKIKIANKETQGIISKYIDNNHKLEVNDNLKNCYYGGEVKVNMPNANLNQIDGKVFLQFSNENFQIEKKLKTGKFSILRKNLM